MIRNMDERLKNQKIKLIYYIALLQNALLAATLIYEAHVDHKYFREVINIHSPVAVAFLIFFIPFLIISLVYGVKNDDDDRVGHGPIIVGSLLSTLIFVAGVFIIDGAISLRMGLVSVGVGVFLFLFSELINLCRHHQTDDVD